ncbi:MAG: hypothetical protein R3321_07685 [Nitrososphaeraceae archaeon]|nr:hypothetical protein [Nitrososphaeraceae archaeon]
MKNLLTLIILICFVDQLKSQNLAVTLNGEEGKKITEIATSIYSDLLEGNAIRVVFLESNCNRNNYYFGILNFRFSLEKFGYPNYYFFNNNSEPVFVYLNTTRKQIVNYSKVYKEEINNITNNILTEWGAHYHYVVFHVKFEEGEQIGSLEPITYKKLRKRCLSFFT